MQSSNEYSVPEKIRQIVKEKQAMFVALEELDRTGKLRKSKYKKRFNFTMDEDIMNDFRSYCLKNNINMSGKIESMLKEFLRSQAKKN